MTGKKRKTGKKPEGEEFALYASYFVSIYTWHGAPLLEQYAALRNYSETYWENIMGTYSNVETDDFATQSNCLHGIIHIDRAGLAETEEFTSILPGKDSLDEKYREVIRKAVDFFKSITEFQWRKFVGERSLQFEGEVWQPGLRIIPIRSDAELQETRKHLKGLAEK